jgi:metacaspase-1
LDWRLRIATQSKIKALTVNGSTKSLNLALISGCKSNQTSADAFIKGRYNGALTYYLLSELKKAGGLTKDLKTIVKNVNASLKKGKYSQEPQLEGSPAIIAGSFLR